MGQQDTDQSAMYPEGIYSHSWDLGLECDSIGETTIREWSVSTRGYSNGDVRKQGNEGSLSLLTYVERENELTPPLSEA